MTATTTGIERLLSQTAELYGLPPFRWDWLEVRALASEGCMVACYWQAPYPYIIDQTPPAGAKDGEIVAGRTSAHEQAASWFASDERQGYVRSPYGDQYLRALDGFLRLQHEPAALRAALLAFCEEKLPDSYFGGEVLERALRGEWNDPLYGGAGNCADVALLRVATQLSGKGSDHTLCQAPYAALCDKLVVMAMKTLSRSFT